MFEHTRTNPAPAIGMLHRTTQKLRTSYLYVRAVSANTGDCSTSSDRQILPKSSEFYSENALKRHYFYVIDTRGQVFLEETLPRNIATSMKDGKFLNFLHNSLRKNETGIHEFSHPFVSYCGKEINYVSPYDRHSAFVFKDLFCNNVVITQSNISETGTLELTYASGLKHPFDIENLVYHPTSGRIYHILSDHKHLVGHLGLLHPFLCQLLANDISWNSEEECYYILWKKNKQQLKTLANLQT